MDDHGNPTSALFKQENGVSVDRDGGRKENAVIRTFRERFSKRFKGLAKVQASVCLQNDMYVLPEPTRDNIYHASIYEDENRLPLSQLHALILADHSEIVAFEPEVKWI
ncbi:MAG: hypothetical protein LUG56_10440 [Lachnospiraceae bacterium]|nr:hypothetical protein [Lachnospiraceae bacterium]